MITLILEPVIWYTYKGDEICWNGYEYISLCTEGGFYSLEAMDRFWEEYLKEMSLKPNGEVPVCKTG